eukprot:scaffold851_cov67-Phaeocystis_antarctica.AAC.3
MGGVRDGDGDQQCRARQKGEVGQIHAQVRDARRRRLVQRLPVGLAVGIGRAERRERLEFSHLLGGQRLFRAPEPVDC